MELLQIKMLNTAVERILNQEMSELGLTYTQTTVIGYLLEHDGQDVCQRDIELSLGLTHPTVSSVLSRMESGGLICTAPSGSDRRYKNIALTDKAKNQAGQISKKYQKVKARLFEGISAEQREQFNSTVQTMLNNISSAK